MSQHIRIYNAGGPEIDHLPLGLTGVLGDYTYGSAYEGELDIVNPVGKCTVRLVDGNLPTGYQLFVDNFREKVVLRLPPVVLSEEREGLPNADFEDGDGGWEQKTGWAIETVPYGGNPNNKAMVYRGAGSSKLLSDRFPVRGQSLNAFSALWNQGPSNKKNVDLYTNLVITDESGAVVQRFTGSKVHDASNKSWHTSSGFGRVLSPDNLYAAIELEVFRRNSRAREVFVDNVEWNLTWQASLPQDDYFLTVEVKDSLGRTALWTGSFSYESVYGTSQLYGLIVEDRMWAGMHPTGLVQREQDVPAPPVHSPMVANITVVGFDHLLPARPEPVDRMTVSMSIVEFIHREPPTARPSERMVASMSLTDFTHTIPPTATQEDRMSVVLQIREFFHG